MTLENHEGTRVLLFGSYDSRGGTTAIAAPDRETTRVFPARRGVQVDRHGAVLAAVVTDAT
jgi:hypothetical protein